MIIKNTVPKLSRLSYAIKNSALGILPALLEVVDIIAEVAGMNRAIGSGMEFDSFYTFEWMILVWFEGQALTGKQCSRRVDDDAV